MLWALLPGEIVDRAGLSMAFLSTRFHQTKADHHLRKRAFLKFSFFLTLKSLAVLVPMYEINNLALTTSVPCTKDSLQSALSGSFGNLVIPVMGLHLHSPEHHVHSVLIHEMFLFVSGRCVITYYEIVFCKSFQAHLLHEVVAPRLCLPHPLTPLPIKCQPMIYVFDWQQSDHCTRNYSKIELFVDIWMSNHETLNIPDGPCEDESLCLGGDRLYGRISIVLHPLHIHHLLCYLFPVVLL